MDFGRNNFVDLSPWMLFEATGDSEFDSSDAAGKVSCTFISSDCSEDNSSKRSLQCMDEDDALSCSWDDDPGNVNRREEFDDSYVSDEDKRRNVDGEISGDQNVQEEEVEGEGEDDEEEEEGAVDQVRDGSDGWRGLEKWRRRPPGAGVEVVMMNMMGLGRRKRRKGCRNPAEELTSQRDTDRHFWEACLSS